MKWLPIESAPRDGSAILAWDADERQAYIVAFAEPDWYLPDDPMHSVEPTHWMPLPEPPTAELENEG